MKSFLLLFIGGNIAHASSPVLTPEQELVSPVIRYATVETGKMRGSLELNYSIEHASRCVADATKVAVFVVKGMHIDPNSTDRKQLLVAFHATRTGHCPRGGEPVVVHYHTQIQNLSPAQRYTVHIAGAPEVGSAFSVREEEAGK